MSAMAVVQVLFVSIVLLLAGYSQSVVVSQADEARAVAATRDMIQRLQQQRPPRVRNVNIRKFIGGGSTE